MLLGTAIYNGTVSVPGLPAKDLLSEGNPAASPALARSPLLTKNASPGVEFGAQGSPYAGRAQLDLDPMSRGEGKGGLRDRLVVSVDK